MIFVNEWKGLTEESKIRWEKNAEFWDNSMGDRSNEFHFAYGGKMQETHTLQITIFISLLHCISLI
jgi:hypothetical protein